MSGEKRQDFHNLLPSIQSPKLLQEAVMTNAPMTSSAVDSTVVSVFLLPQTSGHVPASPLRTSELFPTVSSEGSMSWTSNQLSAFPDQASSVASPVLSSSINDSDLYSSFSSGVISSSTPVHSSSSSQAIVDITDSSSLDVVDLTNVTPSDMLYIIDSSSDSMDTSESPYDPHDFVPVDPMDTLSSVSMDTSDCTPESYQPGPTSQIQTILPAMDIILHASNSLLGTDLLTTNTSPESPVSPLTSPMDHQTYRVPTPTRSSICRKLFPGSADSPDSTTVHGLSPRHCPPLPLDDVAFYRCGVFRCHFADDWPRLQRHCRRHGHWSTPTPLPECNHLSRSSLQKSMHDLLDTDSDSEIDSFSGIRKDVLVRKKCMGRMATPGLKGRILKGKPPLPTIRRNCQPL